MWGQPLENMAVGILERRWRNGTSVDGQKKTSVNDDRDTLRNSCERRTETQNKNLEINKPYTVFQYNKFMKGVDKAGQ